MTHERSQWWQTTTAEDFLADLPIYDSLLDRGRDMVARMARSRLDSLAEAGEITTPDDPVFPCPDGTMKSLNDLIAEMESMEMDHLTGGWLNDTD